jgi:hypothetical protein
VQKNAIFCRREREREREKERERISPHEITIRFICTRGLEREKKIHQERTTHGLAVLIFIVHELMINASFSSLPFPSLL